MNIETIFDGGGAEYHIDVVTRRPVEDVARSMIFDFLETHPRAIVWAFYRKGPFRTLHIQDGIQTTKPEPLSIIRESHLFGFKIPSRESVPKEEYLRGVEAIYLQLCGPSLHAGGIESNGDLTKIGHYDFALPLPALNLD